MRVLLLPLPRQIQGADEEPDLRLLLVSFALLRFYFVSPAVSAAPVDLRKGSGRWTFSDNHVGKSLSGCVQTCAAVPTVALALGILDCNRDLWTVFGSSCFVASAGVYLSKYSDLLQINPFEVGSYGDMVVFKVMRVRLRRCCPSPACPASRISGPVETPSSRLCVPQGRVKHIHENMPKNAIEPSPKFDSHLSKSANRVTSLLSYRAFELTQVDAGGLSPACYRPKTFPGLRRCLSRLQQYFFEFAFDEIKARPRHACPYAVVSFQFKGKEAAVAPMTAHR